MGDAVRQRRDRVTAQTGVAERRMSVVVRRWVPAAAGVALLLWMAVVAGRGALLALRTFGVAVAGEARQNFATPGTLWAAALVCLACLGAALAARRFRAAATLPVAFAMGGVVLLVGVVGSGSARALPPVLGMVALSWLVGEAVLRRLPSPPEAPVARLPVAVAVGLGLLGLLLFGLAALERLDAVAVVGCAGAILAAVLVLDRRHLAADAARLRAWRPAAPGWVETVVVGLGVGVVAFALLSAFVPENNSDAAHDHLPIARELWQSGSVAEVPLIGISQGPVQAHLLYAVAYGLGGGGFAGITAAKLVHAAVGLVAVAGVAGLGWLCAGRVAATVGAAVFATTPLVLWALGHAMVDLFPVLFTVTAALCLLRWQRVGGPGWLVVAGALAGFGIATKLTMGLAVVALAAAVFLVGRGPWRFRERVLAVLVFGLGTVVVVPWLVRTYSITGTLPGLGSMVDSVLNTLPGMGVLVEPVSAAAAADAPRGAAPGHAPLDLLRLPWRLAFHEDRYPYKTLTASPVGITLLLLLPVALLGPRTRATALLAVTAVVSYVAWWASPLQVARHLLPTLAIASALAGAGVAGAVAPAASRQRRVLAAAAPLGVLVGLVAAPVLFLPERLVGISIDRVLGRETAAAYVDREIPSAAVLAAATAELPPDTVVGYVGPGEGVRLYTEARLVTLDAEIGARADAQRATPGDVLETLHRRGIDYFIWDRAGTNPESWRSPLLSTDFLRDHTRIVAGAEDGYLFEVRPGGGNWVKQNLSNLLDDPGLAKAGKDNGPWTTEGKVKARRGGGARLVAEDSVAQQVPVSAGSPYLLVAAGSCAARTDRTELGLRWFDERDVELSVVAESVFLGVDPSEQFLWRRAPDGAASVSAELTMPRGSRCEVGEVALYRVP